MNEINLTATDILERMDAGARLYRPFGQSGAELWMLDGSIIEVTATTLDLLTDQGKIELETGIRSRFYRRIK